MHICQASSCINQNSQLLVALGCFLVAVLAFNGSSAAYFSIFQAVIILEQIENNGLEHGWFLRNIAGL